LLFAPVLAYTEGYCQLYLAQDLNCFAAETTKLGWCLGEG
jgi:hypothetical protein